MLFVDTGAFVARHVERDQYHREASAAWKRLATEPRRLLTSNFVLDEAFTLLARRSGYAFAAQQARVIYTSRELEILRPDGNDELRALDQLEKFADQSVSFTDCVSFVLMQRHGLSSVFTFDQHFERAGFTRWPLP